MKLANSINKGFGSHTLETEQKNYCVVCGGEISSLDPALLNMRFAHYCYTHCCKCCPDRKNDPCAREKVEPLVFALAPFKIEEGE